MLNFKTKMLAFEYLKNNLDQLELRDDLTVFVGEDVKSESPTDFRMLTGEVKTYCDIDHAQNEAKIFFTKNIDKIYVLLNELLINALKASRENINLEKLKQLTLSSDEAIHYTFQESDQEKKAVITVCDSKGELLLKDIIHIFDEKEVTPRKTIKYGAGYGMRNISLYSNTLHVIVDSSSSTKVIAEVPFRGRELQSFYFNYRRSSDV